MYAAHCILTPFTTYCKYKVLRNIFTEICSNVLWVALHLLKYLSWVRYVVYDYISMQQRTDSTYTYLYKSCSKVLLRRLYLYKNRVIHACRYVPRFILQYIMSLCTTPGGRPTFFLFFSYFYFFLMQLNFRKLLFYVLQNV
jgi:hypothetical protein